MLNLIKQMKADLGKLEGLVNALPEKPRSLIRKVVRKAKAGDYIMFNEPVEDVTVGMLYKVWGTEEHPKYTDDTGGRFLVYGWAATPTVYEVVVNEGV